MSLIEPILPSLRAGLSQTVRSIGRPQIIPPSPLQSHPRALKRKITPLQSTTHTSIRPFTSTPRCLNTPPSDPESSSSTPSMPLRERIARAVLTVVPQGAQEQYYSYKKAEDLYKECKLQGEYNPEEEISGKAKFWYEECGLVPCLRNWSSISNLHVWLLMVRIRAINERPRAKMWQQQLINHYFFDLEEILTNRHKVTQATLRQRSLKELFEQFRYAILSYDEAFIRGDAQMAAAIWANVFLLREDMDFQKLAMVVSYVRRVLAGLEKLDEDTILSAGVYFGNPMEEAPVVEKFSEKPAKK